jgi:hypothetical protein
MNISTVSAERSGRVLPGRVVKRPHPEPPYRLHDFLDDQQRLITSVESGPSCQARSIPDLDGDRLVIRLAPSLEAAGARRHAATVFSEKYGPATGATRLAKYCVILEFLEDSRADIVSAGLADDREPMTICEAFVQFLLDWKAVPAQRRIPKCALRRFLDEWGHRWI